MTSSLIGKQAVVVGAGMAGLPAARALADYFEQVVVLERDTLPFVASHRTGKPAGAAYARAPRRRAARAR